MSIKHWLWLATGLRAGRGRTALLSDFSDPEEIFLLSPREIDRLPYLTDNDKKALGDKSLARAETIFADAEKLGIGILTYRDASFPESLRMIDAPPIVLYYRGKLPDFDSMLSVGIVGTRRCTSYGRRVAENLGYQLAGAGCVVVTGMAAGIDAAAARGARAGGISGIAVLGTPVEQAYPVSSRDIYEDLLQNGLVLSEYPPGAPVNKTNFPERNRIISGLSRSIAVVEAPMKSGALITAHFALDQGKDVFAVPGNLDIPTFEGSNRLLAAGEARCLLTPGDLLWEYKERYEILTDTTEMDKLLSQTPGNREGGEPREKEPPPPAFSPEDSPEGKILAVLAAEALTAEDIAALTGIDSASLQVTLTMMEIAGTVTSEGGCFRVAN